MKEKSEVAGAADLPASPSRRKVLIGGAVAAGAALVFGSSPRLFAAPAEKEIRIGYISPRSGELGAFNESDSYMLPLVRKALAKGLHIGGQNYKVTILDRDSQSNPSRASQLAKALIDRDKVNLMLTTSTPETVNPVSDACEAAAVPSIGTDCPLDSFFFGRGGKLGKPSPFKWSFDFSFGVAQFVSGYLSQWPLLKTNKKVAVMYPNDADGMAFREHLAPVLEKNGYKVIDPGAYQDGTTDFSSQIALFNRENCQIFNEVGLPPDIQTFWRQAAQLHFLDKLVIAQFTKSGSFFNQVNALGALGTNVCAETFWAPVFPYKSPLTGGTSKELADGYEKATGHIWAEQQGATLALFEVGAAVLKAARDPTNRAAIRDVIPTLDMITTLGRVNFKQGPYPNTATTPMIGAQWVKTRPGSRFPLDWVTIDNTEDRNVPVQRKPVPYNQRA